MGGEATNPGSKDVNVNEEWKRIFPTLKKLKKKKIYFIRYKKKMIMKKGIKNKINLINDVSGLEYDL